MSDADDIEAARRAIAWLARRAAAAGLKPAAARELLDVLYDYSAMMRAGGNASRAAEIADLGWPEALRAEVALLTCPELRAHVSALLRQYRDTRLGGAVGWRCPVCGAGVRPDLAHCDHSAAT